MIDYLKIYCDESCHLENDNSKYMVIGGIACKASNKRHIVKKIKGIRDKYQFSDKLEIKWTKVSMRFIDMYKELIDLIQKEELVFRCIVINKDKLDHEKYKSNHDDFYYKMYYFMLNYFSNDYHYKIYIDKKDTKGYLKSKKLEEVLNNSSHHLIDYEVLIHNSEEHQIMQVADLFIGAITYKNRELKGSKVKVEICNYLEKTFSVDLTKTSNLNRKCINIFKWKSGDEDDSV